MKNIVRGMFACMPFSERGNKHKTKHAIYNRYYSYYSNNGSNDYVQNNTVHSEKPTKPQSVTLTQNNYS